MAKLKPLPNREAISFLEKKGYKLGYHWADVRGEEHVRGFTVAKVMRLDLLEDIRRVVDKLKSEGMGYRQFSKELMPILERYGWTGWKEMKDPLTGKVKKVELGTPRRLRIIYDTNLRMANAAGRWERLWRNKRSFGWLGYITRDDGRVRAEHKRWHKFAAPIDDPFWDTHYPPNGWFCRCSVRAMTKERARENEFETEKRPPVKMKDWTNPRTGEIVKVPEGISPGFAYNVGKHHMRGLALPPISGPISPPRLVGPPKSAGPGKLPMPKPRTAPASRMLPEDISSDKAVDVFLKEFGATRTRPVVYKDRINQPLVIGEDFFRHPDGTVKMIGSIRKSAALVFADTLKNPDEIWWNWERVWLDRDHTRWRYRLTRRYFARWLVDGDTGPADILLAVDAGKLGWKGVTAFRPTAQDYLERQRGGTLAYRREEES